jgi:hypothetical protein
MIEKTGWLRLYVLISAIFLSVPLPSISQDSPAEAMPGDGEAAGWAKQRSMQRYEGESLYEYIDGGAEIYHEYGFELVAVQDYVNEAGKILSVEIFLMTSPAAAYGTYTFKTDSKGRWIRIGTDAQLADYYLNFWKGPYLVTLTGFEDSEETRQGLLDIARRVDSHIREEGEKPGIASLLPEDGLVSQSRKYFTGILGLRNSHPFFDWPIGGFEQGIKGDYSEGFSFFLFRFGSEEQLQKALELVNNQEDRKGRRHFAVTDREYLLLVLGDIDRSRAKAFFESARKKILSEKPAFPGLSEAHLFPVYPKALYRLLEMVLLP